MGALSEYDVKGREAGEAEKRVGELGVEVEEEGPERPGLYGPQRVFERATKKLRARWERIGGFGESIVTSFVPSVGSYDGS